MNIQENKTKQHKRKPNIKASIEKTNKTQQHIIKRRRANKKKTSQPIT